MDIREIARRAKVSPATVSRTMNRLPTVDPKLAKRVWKVVEDLGYFPNTQARSLVSGRSRIFGLIVSEITNPFFPEIVQTFENLAVENNYEILLTSTVHDRKRMEIAVRRMIERRVDGVAILTFGMEESLLENLKVRKVPLVFVDVGPKKTGISNIHIVYEHGIREGVQHLAALRHSRIAFISGPLELHSALSRKNAFCTAMKEIGLKLSPDLLIEGDHTIEGGIAAFAKLAALRDRPTAVMCSNDLTAIGVMRQAYEYQIDVPQELSVIGFDDVRFAQYMIPPLTTIRMSQSEIAELAFRALMREAELDPENRDWTELTLDTKLVLRKSTAIASTTTKKATRARK
jgi:DNA-binding LacI/PurR family transcriptional regulator